MFKATAFIVGPADGPGAALAGMARRLGFEAVLPFTGVAMAEQQAGKTPLLYFLFAAVDDVAALKPAADAIRFHPGRKVRFSPAVYFSESPSLDAIRACVDMGFDDVITLPFTERRVVQRLSQQLDKTLVYYETSSYFGPDRRRSLRPAVNPDPRNPATQFRRLEIIRSAPGGINVLRDETKVLV